MLSQHVDTGPWSILARCSQWEMRTQRGEVWAGQAFETSSWRGRHISFGLRDNLFFSLCFKLLLYD